MLPRILQWLAQPRADRSLRFACPVEGWTTLSYAELAALVRITACGLSAVGVQRNDGVVIVQRSGPSFIRSFYAAMMIGAVPSPVAPPTSFRDRAAYEAHVANVLAIARPAVVVCDASFRELLEAVTGSGRGPRLVLADDLEAAGDAPAELPVTPGDLALVQFTSGTSGHARGVRVPYAAVDANVAALTAVSGLLPTDKSLCWLPIHHDMGLVGGLIGPVANQCDHLLMQPEQFIRRPLRFLRTLSEQDVTLSGCPPFGLDYIVRKVSSADLGECGFSHVKAVFVGAERIDRGTVDSFMKLMGPRGLRPEAILPAYGGAEATLAVTVSPVTRAWSSVRVEPFSLVLGQRVALAKDGQDIVSCGPPVPGTSVAITDERGSPVPEGTVGEIIVSGPSVAVGYAGPVDEESAQVFDCDRLWTRDAGFMLDGELYVLGRLGDSLKVRGCTLFAEDVEVALRDAGVPSVRSAALLGSHQGTSTVVILLEHLQPGWPGEIMRQLAPLAESVQIVLVQVGGGAILRTSSGKVRRRALWQQYMRGEFPHTVIAP